MQRIVDVNRKDIPATFQFTYRGYLISVSFVFSAWGEIEISREGKHCPTQHPVQEVAEAMLLVDMRVVPGNRLL
jgi:hypothetical protein